MVNLYLAQNLQKLNILATQLKESAQLLQKTLRSGDTNGKEETRASEGVQLQQLQEEVTSNKETEDHGKNDSEKLPDKTWNGNEIGIQIHGEFQINCEEVSTKENSGGTPPGGRLMSWKSILSTIEKDVNEGFGIVAPIIATFDPALGPVLTEIGQIIAVIEGTTSTVGITPATVENAAVVKPAPPTDAQLSAIIQGVTASNVLRQFNSKL